MSPKRYSHLLALGLLFLCFTKAQAQSADSSSNGFLIAYIQNTETTQEERMTYRKYTQPAFNLALQYFWEKQDKRQAIELRLGKNLNVIGTRFMTFQHLRPNMSYTYERKRGGLLLGGYVDIGSLLHFPLRNWEGNNTISYTMWSSMGFSGSWRQALSKDNKFSAQARLRFPLVAYVIRPAYGLPYPDNYLEDGTFDFQRKEMTRHLLTSGKMSTLDRFQQILFEAGLSMHITEKQHQIGLSYVLDYLNYNEEKDIQQLRNGLQLSGIFNL
ncbi:MAG: hypothetical protein AAGI23_08845 [Bacteroidota bacterium]